MDTDRKVLHEGLTQDIIGAAFDVHNALDCGLLEKVYENALAHELSLGKHVVTPQKEFTVTYKDKEVGVYYADLMVDDKVIVEVKSVSVLENIHRAQTLNYLRVSGIRVGLLLNFARPKLKFERLVV
jgi:GxxExxY protein